MSAAPPLCPAVRARPVSGRDCRPGSLLGRVLVGGLGVGLDGRGQDLEAVQQQFVADHQRRQEPQHVAVGAAGEDEQPGGVAGCGDAPWSAPGPAPWMPGLDELDRRASRRGRGRRRSRGAAGPSSRSRAEGISSICRRGRAGPARAIVSMAASAAAHATGLPPYVPPRPPACTASMRSARPVTAASGSPPAMPLAVVIRSGHHALVLTANQSPVRQKPVWISSAMNTTPVGRGPVRAARAGTRRRARRSRPRPGSARSASRPRCSRADLLLDHGRWRAPRPRRR